MKKELLERFNGLDGSLEAIRKVIRTKVRTASVPKHHPLLGTYYEPDEPTIGEKVDAIIDYLEVYITRKHSEPITVVANPIASSQGDKKRGK